MIEEIKEGVVILHGEWVVFVVMALGAFQGNAQPDRGSGVDPVDHLINPVAFRTDPCLHITSHRPVKSCGNPLVKCGTGKKVASNLFNRELIEWHVFIERHAMKPSQ